MRRMLTLLAVTSTSTLCGFLALTGVADATAPWNASTPGTSITADPYHHLTDGEMIQVSGAGFLANDTLSVFECSFQTRLCTLLATDTTDATGSFGPVSVTVSAQVQGHTCSGAHDCIVEGRSSDLQTFANTPISFR